MVLYNKETAKAVYPYRTSMWEKDDIEQRTLQRSKTNNQLITFFLKIKKNLEIKTFKSEHLT
jgi:hypothetical protein